VAFINTFYGWYMVTEIATRNFGDEGRYNVLPQVAQALGIDASTEETLWRDHALAAINYAVLHSFKRMRVSMVDHHTAAKSFADWYGSEMATRGYCPGNWKWIIPPTASSTSSIYLGLNKMTEYTLKPALVGGMSLKRLVMRARQSGFFAAGEQSGVMMKVTMAAVKWRKRILRVSGGIVLYASDGGRNRARVQGAREDEQTAARGGHWKTLRRRRRREGARSDARSRRGRRRGRER
jgi:hypothetical protein